MIGIIIKNTLVTTFKYYVQITLEYSQFLNYTKQYKANLVFAADMYSVHISVRLRLLSSSK